MNKSKKPFSLFLTSGQTDAKSSNNTPVAWLGLLFTLEYLSAQGRMAKNPLIKSTYYLASSQQYNVTRRKRLRQMRKTVPTRARERGAVVHYFPAHTSKIQSLLSACLCLHGLLKAEELRRVWQFGLCINISPLTFQKFILKINLFLKDWKNHNHNKLFTICKYLQKVSYRNQLYKYG